MPTRFADPGVSFYELATHYVVHCPRCVGKAFVKPRSEGEKLVCTACFHTEAPGRWYGAATAFVSVKCRECHAPLRRSAPWDGKWKKLAMHCERCGDDCEYDAHVSYHPMHEGRMTDAVFGLPLWLQRPFRDEQFWAFNYEHLALLEQYVAAKLRERGILPRNSIRKNSSLLSRLPDFIRRAGNRDELLKLIRQLQLT